MTVEPVLSIVTSCEPSSSAEHVVVTFTTGSNVSGTSPAQPNPSFEFVVVDSVTWVDDKVAVPSPMSTLAEYRAPTLPVVRREVGSSRQGMRPSSAECCW